MAEEKTEGWPAELHLGYSHEGGRTVLVDNRHCGPLRVQRPLYPEDGVCHTCILHPPGGVVGGDSLCLNLAVGPQAHALITTPGATKFYRSAGQTAVQRQHLVVRGGILEWLPQETIVFPGAEADIVTEVRLEDGGSFIGWEILCLGLPTRGEDFATGRLDSRLAIYRDGRPLFLDRLRVEGSKDLGSPVGLRRLPVTGCFLATGIGRETMEEMRGIVPASEGDTAGITLLGEVLVARYLGRSSCAAREFFQKLWISLRPRLIGRPACPPRIWAT